MPTNQDFENEVNSLSTRVATLEHGHARMKEAFVKNDLGIPDLDGHRRAHNEMIEQDKVVTGYKRDMTKKVLEWGVVGMVAISGKGFLEWLKGHIV